MLMFYVFQFLSIFKFILHQRLDELKSNTWKLYDQKNSDTPLSDNNLNREFIVSVEIVDKEFLNQLKIYTRWIKIGKFFSSNLFILFVTLFSGIVNLNI
jgi:hypothetical protein